MGCVVSVEECEVSFASTDTSKDYSLTKGQTQAQCAILSLTWNLTNGGDTSSVRADNGMFKAHIVDVSGTPTVRIERKTGDTNYWSATAVATVVEFISDIDVQEVNFNQVSENDQVYETIDAVNLSYAFIVGWNDGSSSVSFYDDDNSWVWQFTSTTEVLNQRTNGGNGFNDSYGYVVYDTTHGDHFSVQYISETVANTMPMNVTITSVDLTKTLVFGSCTAASLNTNYVTACARWALTTSTNLQFNRYFTASSAPTYFRGFVVEFTADDVEVDRGVVSLSTTNQSATDTCSFAWTENSMATMGANGYYPNGEVTGNFQSGGDFPMGRPTVKTSGTDTVAITCVQDDTDTTWDVSWQAINFGTTGRRTNIT